MLNYDLDTGTISIIAKDTGEFVISFDTYELFEGDTVYFTVNDELEKPNPRIQKVITEFEDNTVIVHLSTEDTNIPVGSYYYDVEVDTPAGRVDTIMGPLKFKVLGGVKY